MCLIASTPRRILQTLAALLLVCCFADAAQAELGDKYSDMKYHFSIRPPKDWTLNASNQKDGDEYMHAIFFSPPDEEDLRRVLLIESAPTGYMSGPALKADIETNFEKYEKDVLRSFGGVGFTNLRVHFQSVNYERSTDLVEVIFEINSEEADLKVVTYMSYHNARLYLVYYLTFASVFQYEYDMFQESGRTFEVAGMMGGYDPSRMSNVARGVILLLIIGGIIGVRFLLAGGNRPPAGYDTIQGGASPFPDFTGGPAGAAPGGGTSPASLENSFSGRYASPTAPMTIPKLGDTPPLAKPGMPDQLFPPKQG